MATGIPRLHRCSFSRCSTFCWRRASAIRWKRASASYAVDWTDIESFSSRRTKDGVYADVDAAWGHRKGGGPGERDERFFGYYLQAATMVRDEGAARVPELVRRMTLSSCAIDPPPQMVGVLTSMVSSGVAVREVLVDSGYASRKAERFALPIRRMGADLVMDLHPFDRGTKGTYERAICSKDRFIARPPRIRSWTSSLWGTAQHPSR